MFAQERKRTQMDKSRMLLRHRSHGKNVSIYVTFILTCGHILVLTNRLRRATSQGQQRPTPESYQFTKTRPDIKNRGLRPSPPPAQCNNLERAGAAKPVSSVNLLEKPLVRNERMVDGTANGAHGEAAIPVDKNKRRPRLACQYGVQKKSQVKQIRGVARTHLISATR